ncbi:MAG: glycosyltransferase family 39 protein [Alphaproteobacteria bacterium]|nr:glycosyltransferase family 39 protein [Alphaproteobacteria bacterium]
MLRNLSYKKFLFCALWLLLLINLGQTVYVLLFSGHILFDDVEHLRAAYFISLGDAPYRDFFEHHHPLLWYVLAPIVSIMPHDTITALRIGRFISLGVSLLGGWFIYKTEKRFIGGTLCALFCLVFYFWGISNVSVAGLYHIKPDIYQRCCFFIGLYYLFCYFRYQKFRDLQICALLWTAAFLFLQTTLFYVAPLAVPVCYFLYQNPQKWRDFAKAAVLPLAILAACVAILWKFDMLTRYYETNWLLNSIYTSAWMQTRLSVTKFLAVGDMLMVAVVAICFLTYRQKFNIYTLTLAFCLLVEFILRTFLVTNFIYYLTWLAIFAAMIAAPFITKLCLKYKQIFALFVFVWLLHTGTNFIFINENLFKSTQKYIAQTGGETVLSQVFEKKPAYYWLYPNLESIDDMSFQYVSDYDLEEIYRRHNAQIIFRPPLFTGDYYTICRVLKPTPEQKEIIRRHFVGDFIKENYEEIEEDIYMRKNTLPLEDTNDE